MVAVGFTERLLPVPTNVPPQEAVYQVITSPVPLPPPLSVSDVLCPLQIVDGDALADVGSADIVLTVTVAVNVLGPAQPLASNGVIVNVTVITADVVLVKVPLILPEPLAAIPCTFPVATSPLSLVQV